MKIFFLLFTFLTSFTKKPPPTLILVGNSSIKIANGIGENDNWGWGDLLLKYIDTTKLNFENLALSTKTSRTYYTEGHWQNALVKMKKGDILILQFDPMCTFQINEKDKSRGTITGNGDETLQIINSLTNEPEIIHSYGWYIRNMIEQAKQKKVEVLVCSPSPYNIRNENKTVGFSDKNTNWTAAIASQMNAKYVNLYELTAVEYDKHAIETVQKMYFSHENDSVHTNFNGAELNAKNVMLSIRNLKTTKLKKYLLK